MNALMQKQAQARVGLVIAIAALATLVGFGLSTGTAGAAATKVSLTRTNRACDESIVPPKKTAAQGFVIINTTGSGKLIANVVVQGATANAVYTIRLIQLGDGLGASDCGNFQSGPFDGTVSTDAAGSGQANVQEPLLSNADDAFVVLNNSATPGTDFLTTESVPLRTS